MAEKSVKLTGPSDKKSGTTKKRQLKKTETVRQRAERSTNAAPRKRRVSKAVRSVGRPLRVVIKAIAKLLSPFGFLLIPFKTRPARFIGRLLASVLLFRFFRDAWSELRQVQWPTARETVRLSMAVFVFSLLFGAMVAIVDFGLDKLFKKVFID
jgi:preprotein translocase SecE subunit